MAFLYRKKLNLMDLADRRIPKKKIFLMVEDSFLRGIYSYHLLNEEYEVGGCGRVEDMQAHLGLFNPHLLLLLLSQVPSRRDIVYHLRLARKSSPGLKIVTVGSTGQQETLNRLMDFGISAHIDRRLSRPRDVVDVVKIILNDKN